MTQEQSVRLAQALEMIKFAIHNIDYDYLKLAAQKLGEQATFENTAAILNPRFNPHKNDSVRLSAKALFTLVQYIDALKEIDKAKAAANDHEEAVDKISAMFL